MKERREEGRMRVKVCVCIRTCVFVCVAEKEREWERWKERERERVSHLSDHSPSPHAARPGFPIAHPKRPHGVTVAALLAP